MPTAVSRIAALFQLYLNNTISRPEYEELLQLLNVDTISQTLEAELKQLWIHAAVSSPTLPNEVWDKKLQALLQEAAVKPADISIIPIPKWQPRYRFKWAAAAALLIFFSGIVYFIFNRPKSSSPTVALTKKDTSRIAVPGYNKAVLVLADGTSLVLDDSSNGAIASQGTTKVIKLNNGALVYNPATAPAGTVLYNTLSTPPGGQYQVTLADGTVVWLNAGSSLRYPTAFAGNERTVEITGEAYFEVTKDAHKPFKVTIRLADREGGEVEVLGTHFNVNAYDDETLVRTTLLEGSVKVTNKGGTAQLKPGQQIQAFSSGQNTVVSDVDLEETVAWKEGRFQFENADIQSIMRQLARWYGISVAYNGTTTRHFDGTFSRSENISKVLNMLELTGEVKFKLEGKKVLVIL